MRRNIAKYTYLRHINTFAAAIPDENKAHLRAGSYYSRPAYIKNNKRSPGNAPQTRRAWIYYFCKKYFWPKP